MILHRFLNKYLSLKISSQYAIISLLILIIAFLDFITPKEMSVRFFYLLPLFLASWNGKGYGAALIFSFICTIVNFYTDFLLENIYLHGFYLFWEFSLVWAFFVVFVISIAAIRNAYILLENKNEALRTADKVKDEMLRIASHDLKNPLSNIMGISSYITEMKNLSRDEILELNQLVFESTARMSYLVEEYLSNNTTYPGKIRITVEKFPVEKILKRLLDNYRFKAKMKLISIEMADPEKETYIYADEMQAYQVLDNILSNAIKYSPSGKTVKIKVDPDAPLDKNRNNGYTVIEIKDEGPGFSEADKARVFEEATRLSAVPTGGESSTGHGLYIARKLVIEMGGTIRLESISGNGSSFFVAFRKAT